MERGIIRNARCMGDQRAVYEKIENDRNGGRDDGLHANWYLDELRKGGLIIRDGTNAKGSHNSGIRNRFPKSERHYAVFTMY